MFVSNSKTFAEIQQALEERDPWTAANIVHSGFVPQVALEIRNRACRFLREITNYDMAVVHPPEGGAVLTVSPVGGSGRLIITLNPKGEISLRTI